MGITENASVVLLNLMLLPFSNWCQQTALRIFEVSKFPVYAPVI